MKWLCWFIHIWITEEHFETCTRTCSNCGKKQIWLSHGPYDDEWIDYDEDEYQY